MLSLGGRLPGNIKLLKTYSPLEYTLAIEAPQIASYLETFLKNFVLDVQPPDCFVSGDISRVLRTRRALPGNTKNINVQAGL